MVYKLGQYTLAALVIHDLELRVKMAAVMLLSITVLRAEEVAQGLEGRGYHRGPERI